MDSAFPFGGRGYKAFTEAMGPFRVAEWVPPSLLTPKYSIIDLFYPPQKPVLLVGFAKEDHDCFDCVVVACNDVENE